jgi:4-amino-4-deoxy-L-arabinose transferase-like glycosyltransferase
VWAVGISAIAVVALVVRLLYVTLVAAHVPLGFDAVWYTLVSGEIAGGHGFVDPALFFTGHGSVATATHAPLYPAALAAITRVINGHHSTFRVFGAAAGTVTVVATGFIGRRIGGPATGLLAAGIAAVYPSLIAIDGALMSETLTVPLLTGMVWLALVTIERPSWWRYALFGVLGGLATLARPDAVIAAAFIVVATMLASENIKRRLLDGAIAAVVLIAVVSPWVVRNAVQVNAPTLATTSTSGTIQGANCPLTYRGTLIGYWTQACVDAVNPGDLDEAAYSSRLTRQGEHYARTHFAEVPLVVAIRQLRAFGLFSPRQQARLDNIETRSYHWQLLAWVAWLPVFVLGTFGLVRVARQHGRAALPLFATVAATVVTITISYGNQRFRTTCEPTFLVGTAVALAAVASKRTRRPGEHASRPVA